MAGDWAASSSRVRSNDKSLCSFLPKLELEVGQSVWFLLLNMRHLSLQLQPLQANHFWVAFQKARDPARSWLH